MNFKKSTIIIAEAGVNHNGDINTAHKLVDAAKDSGADYVKFQTFNTDKLVSRKAPKAAYQRANSGSEKDQYQMLKKLELSESQFRELKTYCDQSGIGFLSTAFDSASIDFLASLDPDYVKIPSGEITNLPYLQKVSGLGKPVLLSTGMATMQEVEQALAILQKRNDARDLITVLHCTSAYPTPPKDVNLGALKSMAGTFNVPVGYSDHTLGRVIPLAAVALGALVLEKHLTLDCEMEGPDHSASMEPQAFKTMVKEIRMLEEAKGNGIKKPMDSEKENRIVARKSIHLSNDVQHAVSLEAHHLVMLRPGDGISPMERDQIVGRTLKRDLSAGRKLKWTDLS